MFTNTRVCDLSFYLTLLSVFAVYGFTGVADHGRQPCLALASAVTKIGRQLIEQTKSFCEQYVPGSEVVYGRVTCTLE
jgi:DNA polymerase elongation subunit (family B)